MRLRILASLLALLIAGCEVLDVPTVTPTPTFTGPTMASTAIFRGEFPTESPLSALGQNDPTAAAMPRDSVLPPLAVDDGSSDGLRQTVAVTLSTGIQQTADLYGGGGTNRVPGVLMLGPSREGWQDMPLRLQAAGFTVLVTDLPGTMTISDVEILLESLSDVSTVDPGMMAVVGLDNGAELALNACADDELCDAVVLLAPTQTQTLLLAMDRYNPRALFVAASQDDAVGADALARLEDYARGEVRTSLGVGTGRGFALLDENPQIGDELVRWLRGQF
jgi:hypothetical protein